MAVAARTRRFSVAEYHRMAEAGILGAEDRVELVEGVIVEMTPISARHAVCVDRLNQRFHRLVGDLAIVRVQNPVSLGPDSEPQPDVVLCRPPLTRYTESHPGAADLFLVVEVADTSLEDDRTRKVPLYARAGIPEVWIVDLRGEAIEVHRAPGPEGYGSVQAVGRGRTLAPEALPDVSLAVEDFLG
jgi:hypothetical protein